MRVNLRSEMDVGIQILAVGIADGTDADTVFETIRAAFLAGLAEYDLDYEAGPKVETLDLTWLESIFDLTPELWDPEDIALVREFRKGREHDTRLLDPIRERVQYDWPTIFLAFINLGDPTLDASIIDYLEEVAIPGDRWPTLRTTIR